MRIIHSFCILASLTMLAGCSTPGYEPAPQSVAGPTVPVEICTKKGCEKKQGVITDVHAKASAPATGAGPRLYLSIGGSVPAYGSYAGPGGHQQEVKNCHYSRLFGKLCEVETIRWVADDQPYVAECGTTPPVYEVGQVRFGRGGMSVNGSSYSQTYCTGLGHADFQGFNYGPGR